jgi:hypothetical protein
MQNQAFWRKSKPCFPLRERGAFAESVQVTARLLTTPLRVFLGASIAAVAVAFLVSRWPQPLPAVLEALQVGDVEHEERVALLQRIFAAANESVPGADVALIRAMAAIALDDEAGYRKLCGGRALPFAAAPSPEQVQQASLGDPVLGALLRAMVRESVADRDGARDAYSQVERSSFLFRMPLAQRLAAEGRERIR